MKIDRNRCKITITNQLIDMQCWVWNTFEIINLTPAHSPSELYIENIHFRSKNNEAHREIFRQLIRNFFFYILYFDHKDQVAQIIQTELFTVAENSSLYFKCGEVKHHTLKMYCSICSVFASKQEQWNLHNNSK